MLSSHEKVTKTAPGPFWDSKFIAGITITDNDVQKPDQGMMISLT